MRIIGGKFKGKKMYLPIDTNTRPLRDLVKESIFNVIEHSNKFKSHIHNADILDLFSGSGSFGLECFSRGAKEITFIENYTNALKILKKNIFKINAVDKCKIIEEDCFDYFERSKSNKKFNIIFLAPPYREQRINILIEKIKKKIILKKDGIIIIHRHQNDEIDISNTLNILDFRKYGISKIIIGN